MPDRELPGAGFHKFGQTGARAPAAAGQCGQQEGGDRFMTDTSATDRRTALHQRHVDRGARMVSYAGWNMPVQYTGIIGEHQAVREAAGLFDLGHMGEVEVTGPDAEAFLQWTTTNDVSK